MSMVAMCQGQEKPSDPAQAVEATAGLGEQSPTAKTAPSPQDNNIQDASQPTGSSHGCASPDSNLKAPPCKKRRNTKAYGDAMIKMLSQDMNERREEAARRAEHEKNVEGMLGKFNNTIKVFGEESIKAMNRLADSGRAL
jgi:hypothetical protein